MVLLLSIISAVLAIFGVVRIIQGDILWGVILILLALAVGPGGYSLFL